MMMVSCDTQLISVHENAEVCRREDHGLLELIGIGSLLAFWKIVVVNCGRTWKQWSAPCQKWWNKWNVCKARLEGCDWAERYFLGVLCVLITVLSRVPCLCSSVAKHKRRLSLNIRESGLWSVGSFLVQLGLTWGWFLVCSVIKHLLPSLKAPLL